MNHRVPAVLTMLTVVALLLVSCGDGVRTVETGGDEADRGPASIDGRLDCAGDVQWAQIATLAPDAVGEPTAEKAIEAALRRYADRLGGTIKSTGPTTGSVVVDDREQVTANAIQVSSGGWVVDGLSGCEGAGP